MCLRVHEVNVSYVNVTPDSLYRKFLTPCVCECVCESVCDVVYYTRVADSSASDREP